jgi:macrolide transport system ATP-binding/permease protein
MIEAMMLCLFGGLVGMILSLVAAMVINLFQNKLTAHIDLIALFAAIGVSTLVGLIFGTVPARRAAALSPVDALARE